MNSKFIISYAATFYLQFFSNFLKGIIGHCNIIIVFKLSVILYLSIWIWEVGIFYFMWFMSGEFAHHKSMEMPCDRSNFAIQHRALFSTNVYKFLSTNNVGSHIGVVHYHNRHIQKYSSIP